MPAVTQEFRHAEGEVPKVPGLKVMQWYTGQLNKMSACDRDVMYRFVNVVHMLKPASVLFAPSEGRWASARCGYRTPVLP
jgi:hypothetical protein